MNLDLGLGSTLLAGDPRLVDHIVGEVKSQGIFDQFRKECIADVDTKPAYQNLRTRVESSVNSFLGKQTWKADLNKNQLRETLRKHIVEAPYLDAGVERIVDQVVNPKVYSVFMPQIEDVVYKFLGLERPKNRQRNGPCGFKDLLPKDLDPVSPESDKNSLKDVSLDSVDAHMEEPDARDKELLAASVEQSRKDDIDNNSDGKDNGRNGVADIEEKSMDDSEKSTAAVNLNSSVKSEEKTEEEEEDSPTFEPIDIMNLNESNVSNDSHLSGISELTSHRSRSPDFSNEASRDNMDFSNQDSQFSKVSSDSRLSIVTDFGSSNHASTPMSDAVKDEKTESKYTKDNFKAVREFESGKINKEGKMSYESERSKENTPCDFKPIRRSFSSKETSRDGMESGTKDSQRNDSKSRRSDHGDSKKDRDKDNRKKQNNYDAKSSEKSSKKSVKDKPEEKSREKDKEKEKKEPLKKDKAEGKEAKDLKDIYKEKIRELREKKELTEKEKLSKDKDAKTAKETKDKPDYSSKDRRDSKEHKSSSSKSSSRSENKNSKSSSNPNESKSARSESRDKGKRDERRYSKDYNKSKSVQDEKSDAKRLSRSDEKTEKSEIKDSKQKNVAKKDAKNGDKKESKVDPDKEKKRREEKKAKPKDDHSSLRKNSEDRRSTDRDGSNGSNGKSSQKSGSSSSSSSAKPAASNLPKESTNTSNSSSETSDSIEESQNEKLRLSFDGNASDIGKNSQEYESQAKKLDLGQSEVTLPIKKRPIGEGSEATSSEVLVKKPKFAKNFQEAKRLMKIRRKMEKEKLKKQQETEKIVDVPTTTPEIRENVEKNDLAMVPDNERVQIVEVWYDEDEPYPEIQSDFTLEERSQIILGAESIFTSNLPANDVKAKSTLSEMELSIRQSLNEMISDKKIEETEHTPKNKDSTVDSETREDSQMKTDETADEETTCQDTKISPTTEETSTKDSTDSETDKLVISESPVESVEHEEKEDNEKVEKEEEGGEDVKEIKVEKDESSEKDENDTKDKMEYVADDESGKVDEEIAKPENAEASKIVGKPEVAQTSEIVEKQEDAETSEIVKQEDAGTSEIVVKQEDAQTSENPAQVEAPNSLENDEAIANKVDDEKVDTLEATTVESKSAAETVAPEHSTPPEIEAEPRESTSADAKESCNKMETSCREISTTVDDDSAYLSDDVPCLYFTEDNERLERFTKFLRALEMDEECSSSSAEPSADAVLVVASSGTEEVAPGLSAEPMAPPKSKRKYSTSPLTDILLNNGNNNNDAHKVTAAIAADEDATAGGIKKRKIGRPKKQRTVSLCGQQNLLNGENFVMPLSPESDVSATSEKTPSNPLKDEKSRPRGSNQRYTSDDLYKPRPLFASSSRRSRKSNNPA